MPKEEQLRGSEQLLSRLADAKILDQDSLAQLVGFTRKRGVRLVHWWIRGQPRPDWVEGAFLASPGSAPGLITDLLRFNRVRFRLDVFPYGIPVPDEIMIKVQNAGQL